jgi:hypothetical protein
MAFLFEMDGQDDNATGCSQTAVSEKRFPSPWDGLKNQDIFILENSS